VVFVDQLPAQEDGSPDRVKVKELYKAKENKDGF